ncbi:SapC family protein [Luteibacter sp. PPL201]|uniref:SapC family protein n=1 Tax=Luteibacter sahnii TaxID=3021977 RepID=A0ABT6B6I7_9GAMM|nr:SapC family protein [Luteibacter sp. PPL193]MDY1548343.1 SapC family protein [Luteibacter sp. PPL193]
MAEVLFYERPVPLNRTTHRELRLKAVNNIHFAAKAHSVPLTGVEFAPASRDFPILFAGETMETAGPMALLGLRQNENLLVGENGFWEQGLYIPAFVRRYPFVLAEKPAGTEGDDFTVFLDEAYEGFNETEGERLFNEDGTDAPALTNAVNFLGEFQDHVARTQWFMGKLREHDLLEPRTITLQKEGKGINLNGLFVINEEKLRNLDEKTAHEFLREGAFGWIYAHLVSLANIDRMAARLDARERTEDGATPNA